MLKLSYNNDQQVRQAFTYFRRQIQANNSSICSGFTCIQNSCVELCKSSQYQYKLLLKIRCRLAHLCEQASPFFGEIEVDESYFGTRRVRGKRGRGASGKTIVFGLLKRHDKVFTEIVPDTWHNYSRSYEAR